MRREDEGGGGDGGGGGYPAEEAKNFPTDGNLSSRAPR